MANFRFNITTAGREVLAQAQSGATLKIVRMELGSGISTGSLDVEALTDKKLELAITSVQSEGTSTTISAQIQFNEVVNGFDWNEVGLIVEEPDTQLPILYFYGNTGGDGDYIPSASEATVMEKIIRIVIDTSNIDSITFDASKASQYFVTHEALNIKIDEVTSLITTEESERKEADADLQEQINNIKLTPVDATRAVGELILGLWEIGQQPQGFYPCCGDTYAIDSPVGQFVKDSLPSSIKKLFSITEDSITFPDFTSGESEQNEFGYFPRFGKIAGVRRSDAIRNITGGFYGAGNNLTVGLGQADGAFTEVPPAGIGLSSADYDNQKIFFDASRVVPVASENRPQMITVIPYIYLGIDYQAPEADEEGVYIPNKLISKLGYIEPYRGSEAVGYYNKAIPVEAGAKYSVNAVKARKELEVEPRITQPLPDVILTYYGLGIELDENKNYIRPITHTVIDGTYNSTNRFIYFEVSENTHYIMLNIDEAQLATYRISKTSDVWNSSNPSKMSNNDWAIYDIPMYKDEGVSYFKNGVYQIRTLSGNDGANFANVRPSQSYINPYQVGKERYPNIEWDNYNLIVGGTQYNNGIDDWWIIESENIYDYHPEEDTEEQEPEELQPYLKLDAIYDAGASALLINTENDYPFIRSDEFFSCSIMLTAPTQVLVITENIFETFQQPVEGNRLMTADEFLASIRCTRELWRRTIVVTFAGTEPFSLLVFKDNVE